MDTAYEVLPATRAWTVENERLAAALVEGRSLYRGEHSRGERAALGLLMRDDELPILGREELVPYIWRQGDEASVRWAYLAIETRASRVPLPHSMRALIQIACSLASDAWVNLGEALKALPHSYAEAVIDAITYACGVTR